MKENKKPKILRQAQDKIIVVLGPTASGKSSLAVKIAQKFNGEIISADSRQVYKGLNIGSGKIIKKEMRGIPHHLLDVASPKNRFTVAQYQKLAQKAIKKIIAKGKIPIICGGTAFYVYSLIYDWKFPEVLPQKKLRERMEKKSVQELFKQLKKLDPQRAKNIDKNNKRRLVRALEILLTTKKTIPALGTINSTVDSSYQVLKLGVKKGKIKLKKLIKIRLEKRLKQGMVKEVENLHNPPAGGGLSWKRLDELGLEYRYISYYLRKFPNLSRINLPNESRIFGKDSREKFVKNSRNAYQKMIEILNQKIWQFSKRQMTWFKKDPVPEQARYGASAKIKWVKNYKKTERLIKRFISS